MARIRHPNVVAIHGAGIANNSPYLVLDYVEGENLGDRLRRGPLKPRHAAKLVRDLAAALEVSHLEGVLHRDLKPANVLIDRKGKVLLTDFGLAKNMFDGDVLTMSETVLGTPAYMSPEQAMGAGDRVGPQSDVYGLGAILYALLTGQPPVQGKVVTEVLEKVIHEPPQPPTSIVDSVDPQLEAIVLRCLEKEPEDRYASAKALKEALHRYLVPPARAASVSGKALLGSTALGSAMGFALGVGATLAFWSPSPPQSRPAPRPVVYVEPTPPLDESEPPPQPPHTKPAEAVTPPSPPTPEEPTPEPLPIPQADKTLMEFQGAVSKIVLNLPQGRISNPLMDQFFGPPDQALELEARIAAESKKDLDNALRNLDDQLALQEVEGLLERGEPWAVRLAVRGLARLGRVTRCARLLSKYESVDDAAMGFTAWSALREVLSLAPADPDTTEWIAVNGGTWEVTDGMLRSSGKPLGPKTTTFLLVRDSERPTGRYRLNLRLDLRHLQRLDSAGVVFGAESPRTFWTAFLRRKNASTLSVRVGSVDRGTPDMKTLGEVPFANDLSMQVDLTARTVTVAVGDLSFTHTLEQPVPQGYRGVFRSGPSIVRYGRLSYQPR